MYYTKPNLFCYRLAQFVSRIAAAILFRPQVLRNEIKDAKGPFVVIANHQSMLDFLSIINLTRRPMHFVISHAFFRTLPITGFLKKMGVIPKLQFQTSVTDMKKMKSVIKNDQPLVIYPAGLMCADGLSTPVPDATYKFLQWLKADVYVARCRGTYFAMPKWANGVRPGKTTMDVYKLFSKEELAAADLAAVQQKVDDALLYDAYREQEQLQAHYHNNDDIRGLRHVLYMCPHCKEEFTIKPNGKNALRCRSCGYEVQSDKLAFLHNTCGFGPELRYVSDWSCMIQDALAEQVQQAGIITLEDEVTVEMIDEKTNKFTEVGQGTLRLDGQQFTFRGKLSDKIVEKIFPVANFPTLPFKTGKHMDIQQGDDIYRCHLKHGHLVSKFINLLKIYYRLQQACQTAQSA